MLSRTAVQALRPATAAASTSRAAIARAPLGITGLAARAYATDLKKHTDTLRPPAPEKPTETYIKRFRGKGFPNVPGLRHLALPFHPHLYQGNPLRELTIARRRKGGRNSSGQVVNRGVGGGHKQRIRVVDFHRLEAGPHDVVRIEYDPGRSGHIALVHRRGAATERVSPDEGAILADTEASDEQYHGATRAKRNEVKGGWSYILAPDGLRAGDVVQSYRSGIPEDLVEGWADAIKEGAAKAKAAADGEDAQINSHSTAIRALGMMRMLTIKPGNVLPLSLIPAGTIVHNISLRADGRMALCRSAGTFGQVVAHHGPQGQALGGGEVLHMGGVPQPDGTYSAERGSVLVKLQSGEVRRIGPSCIATVGVVSNKEHQQKKIGKAGRNRWLGHRPKVRGTAMNTCDHPHGGGRGKSKGNKAPRSPTGLLQGKRTRRPKDKHGNKAVVTQRPRGRASK